MATSSAMSTDNQYIKYTITITQNSQSVSSNTSNVTVSVRFYRTNTGYTTYGHGTVYCKIDGTTYSASVTTDDVISNSGIVLFSKTLNIAHNSDGAKTLICSAWIDHSRVESSEQSYSQTLTTIPRASSFSVANGTLGTAQTITVTRKSTSFTHTITYICGSASGTICTKSSSTSISFTPPLTLAGQNTTGVTVSVKFALQTYSGSTAIGNAVSQTVSMAIPSNVKPTVSLTVTDPTGHASTYGNFVKGLSTFKVVVTPTIAYGSSIASYKTTANGATYTASSFTTGILTNSGSLTVSSTVTDKRGRIGTASVSKTVLDYTSPVISALSVRRCDMDGTGNDQGEYIRVGFTASVTDLNSINTATYTLEYKKSTDTVYTTVELIDLDNVYAVTDHGYIFAADTGSSYDVRVTVTDSHNITTKSTSASTAFTLMSFKADGTAVGIGKVAEESDLFDINLPTRFLKSVSASSISEGGVPLINKYAHQYSKLNNPNYWGVCMPNGTEEGWLRAPDPGIIPNVADSVGMGYLGTSDFPWAHLYVKNINGNPFDYELGTWTPSFGVVDGSGTGPTVSYAKRFGRYTRIGRLVHIAFVIEATITAAGTGYALINGLPYTCNGGANFYIGLSENARGFSSTPNIAYVYRGTYIRIQSETGTSAVRLATANPMYLSGSGIYEI